VMFLTTPSMIIASTTFQKDFETIT
jgi:hypothetical protein